MKLKKIFFISGLCIIISLLISCGENKQKPDFTVSNNITNGKIQNDDTLTIRVNSINKNLDFAWHLDEVTKNLKPYILSKKNNELINLPDEQSCISKNFWY